MDSENGANSERHCGRTIGMDFIIFLSGDAGQFTAKTGGPLAAQHTGPTGRFQLVTNFIKRVVERGA